MNRTPLIQTLYLTSVPDLEKEIVRIKQDLLAQGVKATPHALAMRLIDRFFIPTNVHRYFDLDFIGHAISRSRVRGRSENGGNPLNEDGVDEVLGRLSGRIESLIDDELNEIISEVYDEDQDWRNDTEEED